jgi:hypothetical protein
VGGAATAIELTGLVQQLTPDGTFTTYGQFAGLATVQTVGADGRPVVGAWNGTDPFVLDGVRSSPEIWVLTTPQNPMAADALPGLQAVETDDPDMQGRVTQNLSLIHASELDLIYSFATMPLSSDASKAQVILRFVDMSSTSTNPPPLPGIAVRASTAEDLLYGSSGSFSDVATATDSTGIVILANVGAAAWPGAAIHFDYTDGGARTGGQDVFGVVGAVTLATIPL